MATVKKTIGRLPVYRGDWVAGTYSMLNQVTYLGSTFQSKIDNNTSQPATVVNNALQVNANWSVVSNGTAAYLADARLTAVENTKANQSEVDRLEQGIDAKIATKAEQSEVDSLRKYVDNGVLHSKGSVFSFPTKHTILNHSGIIKDKSIIIDAAQNSVAILNGSVKINAHNWFVIYFNNVEVYRLLDQSMTKKFIVLNFDESGNCNIYIDTKLVATVEASAQAPNTDLYIDNQQAMYDFIMVSKSMIPIEYIEKYVFNMGRVDRCAIENQYVVLTGDRVIDIERPNSYFWVTVNNLITNRIYKIDYEITTNPINSNTLKFTPANVISGGSADIPLPPNEVIRFSRVIRANSNKSICLLDNNAASAVTIKARITAITSERLYVPQFTNYGVFISDGNSVPYTFEVSQSKLYSDVLIGSNTSIKPDYVAQELIVGDAIYKAIKPTEYPMSSGNWKKITP